MEIRMKKIPPAHLGLFKLLSKSESKNIRITIEQLLKATGWKDSSLKTYLGKGQLPYLIEEEDGQYSVSGVNKLSPVTFSKHLSQSKHRRELGHNCKSKLSKALLRRAKDNMILALETYNRPSLQNRLDAFVLLFCTAWEQLLKAELIELNGENSIYKEVSKSGRERETISLRECLERLYQPTDPIRRNLEQIKHYRDKATHLLMPELQFLVSRIFQSGVQNYAEEFEEFTEQKFIEQDSSGLMTIVGDFQEPNVVRLREIYGSDVGEDLYKFAQEIEKDVIDTDDIKYAIPLDIKLVFAKSGEKGETFVISKAEEGMGALKNAVVIEKPVDRIKTHPYKTTTAIIEIDRQIKEKLDESVWMDYLPARDAKSKRAKFGQNCFQSAIHHFKWKNDNNKYHYKNPDPETHYYSAQAIDTIVKNVVRDKNFLKRVKIKYSRRKKV